MGLQKFRFDREGEPYPNGGVPVYTDWVGGPSLAAVRNCKIVGVDVPERTAYVQGEPDTFFSIPAKVKIFGKTATGWLGQDPEDKDTHSLVFHLHTDEQEWVLVEVARRAEEIEKGPEQGKKHHGRDTE